MKDEIAREKVSRLKADTRWKMEEIGHEMAKLEKRLLEGLSVRDCPVCKHETLQKKGEESFPLSGSHLSIQTGWEPYDYLCLNCGSKLVCKTKQVCTVLKEEK